jgi:hypothetical protein
MLEGFRSRCQIRRLALGERSARHHRVERLAVEQFRDDIGQVVLDADVEHRQDIGMVERGRGFRFLLEAPQAVRILGEGGR